MRKALKLMAVLAAFGLTAWIGVVALAQGGSVPTPATATTTTSPTGGDDVKGNCDEAEHANDPECVGVNPVPEDNDQGDVNDDDQGENEGNDDQGENDDDQGEDQGDDDQGDNSGPGSENSGPGSSNSGDGS